MKNETNELEIEGNYKATTAERKHGDGNQERKNENINLLYTFLCEWQLLFQR